MMFCFTLPLIDSLKNKPNLGKMFIFVKGALENKIKCLRLGANDYLAKPIDSTEFLLRTVIFITVQRPSVSSEFCRALIIVDDRATGQCL